MRLHDDFDTFHDRIILGKTQKERIESAVNALTELLLAAFELGPSDVFLQGSFPNGTAVKPDPEGENGEYDVDLVAICAGADQSPEEALADLEAALSENEIYRKRIDRSDPGRPCVRLKYADEEIGGFHVDLVPARRTADAAVIEIPRPGENWKRSAPDEYRKWCIRQGDDFSRCVRMLKRWRDHSQDARHAVRSIVLQVLIYHHMPAVDNDADRITQTLRGIAGWVGHRPSKPEIRNPVLLEEDLAERWSHSDYERFRSVIERAADLAQEAFDELDFNRSRALWRELFGRSFPGPQEGGGSHSPALPPNAGRSEPQRAPRVEWG